MSLEDDVTTVLRRRAEDLAPLSIASARAAVRGRTARARRRRTITRRVGSAAVVAVVVVVASVVSSGHWRGAPDDADLVTGHPPADSADREPPPSGAGLPALTVDDAALQPAYAMESPGDFGESSDGLVFTEVGEPLVQVFRRSQDYGSPTAYVVLWPSLGGELSVRPPIEPVRVGSHDAQLSTANPFVPAVGWLLPDDRVVHVSSWGLSREELLQFASGLERRPDGTGFDATTLPLGLTEDPVESHRTDVANRYLRLESGAGVSVTISIDRGDERFFESFVEGQMAQVDQIEQVTVLGRPAILLRDRRPNQLTYYWTLTWRHSTSDLVTVHIAAHDRTEVGRVIAGFREIDEAAWQDLLDTYG